MREKIARAIREHHRTHVRQPARTNETRRTFHQGDKEAADAVLAAMREPTEAMLAAGLKADNERGGAVDELDVWQAMIDAATDLGCVESPPGLAALTKP